MELISELGKAIGSQGPWAAACVALFGILVFVVLKWVGAVNDLQEKRVAEKESTVIALRAGNETNAKLADALAASTAAMESHKLLTIELSKDVQANDEHWKLRAPTWEAANSEMRKGLEENRVLLATILARLGVRHGSR